MSITYDPVKWTNPLRQRGTDRIERRSKSPVVVSLRDLRYFKSSRTPSTASVSAFLEKDDFESQPPEEKRAGEE